MASYLGHTTNVVQLVNEDNIHPDITDSLGNSAVMYATVSTSSSDKTFGDKYFFSGIYIFSCDPKCGDRVELIHFLVEAGANVNSYNDSCCTPLAVALIRFICAYKDIPLLGMLQALLPPPIIPVPRMYFSFNT